MTLPKDLTPMIVDVGDAIAVRDSLLNLHVMLNGKLVSVPFEVIDHSSEVQTLGDCGALRVQRWWASKERLI